MRKRTILATASKMTSKKIQREIKVVRKSHQVKVMRRSESSGETSSRDAYDVSATAVYEECD